MDTKILSKNRIIVRAAAIAVSLIFFGHSGANAATLQINSNSTTLSPGDTTTLYVVLNSEGAAVNNAESTIKFPTDLFDVVSVNKNGSVFTLWVEEPTFSNSAGTVTFNGGVPTPGYTGSRGSVLSITVRAKKTGQAQFAFSGAAVRANDGLGTDVLNNKLGKSINVVAKEVPAVKNEEPVIKKENLVETVPESPTPALQISSLTHPNQDLWYGNRNPVFTWTAPSGADAIQTGIDNNESSVPNVTYNTVINEKTVKDLEDGVWYFKARARKNGIWGETGSYIVRIDTTSPQKKDTVFSYDDSTKILNIAADFQDTASGIDHFEVFINKFLVKNIPADGFANGNYSIEFDTPGNNNVKLVAIDRAGNSNEAVGSFHTTSITPPRIETIQPTVSNDEQLLIHGTTQYPDTETAINIKQSNGEVIALKTRSNSSLEFFVLAPKLKSGNYDIWAETGSGDNKASSGHIRVKSASRLLITLGSSVAALLYLIVSVISIIILLVLGINYLRHHYSKYHQRVKVRVALINGDNAKVLSILKKRLEKHLDLLQRTRHARILTKEEKEIKEAIEGDLDEVDKAIEDQKS